MQFTGTYTALVTPFRDDRIDAGAYARLIDWQIDAGVDGFVAVGTTGESATLDHDEHLETIRLGVEAARGRCKVIAGTGSNATREAIALTQAAEGLGADAALVVTPYYNKPSQEGLYRHYRAVAEATKLPVLLYSVPSRCGVEIGPETARRLAADCANVVAIKEAGGQRGSREPTARGVAGRFHHYLGRRRADAAVSRGGRIGGDQRHLERHPPPRSPRWCARSPGATHGRHGGCTNVFTRCTRSFSSSRTRVPAKTALALMKDWMTPDVRMPLCEMSKANFQKPPPRAGRPGTHQGVSGENPLAVVLYGAGGRMGQAILACVQREPERYHLAEAGGEVAIDFSGAAAIETILRTCRDARMPLVIGTTGHDDAQRALIAAAAKEIPIVFAANFSVGVNTLFWLTRQAARILGPDFDLEIVETHHRLKKDAPSGTARRLAEILAEARGLDYDADTRHGREGIVGARGARGDRRPCRARRRRGGRTHRPVRRRGRTRGADPPGVEPGDLRAGRVASSRVVARTAARFVRHGGRARLAGQARHFAIRQPDMKTPSLLAVLCLAPFLGGSSLLAQSSNQTNMPVDAIHTGGPAAAQAGMDVWLGIVDDGQYAKGWTDAAEIFKKAVTQTQWTNAATARRAPLGKMLSRKLRSVNFSKTLPGAPAGDYAVALYDTSFEHKQTSVETVTSTLDTDGVWRVSGYMVK